MLRPFLPQLQRSFVKSLVESDVLVRENAAKGLSVLIPHQSRLDPLVTELLTCYSSAQDDGIKAALLDALYGLVSGVLKSKKELNESSKSSIQTLILSLHTSSSDNQDVLRMKSGILCGVYLLLLDSSHMSLFLNQQIYESSTPHSWTFIHSCLCILNGIFDADPNTFNTLNLYSETLDLILQGLEHDKEIVLDCASLLAGKILSSPLYSNRNPMSSLLPRFIEIFSNKSQSPDSRRACIMIVKDYAKTKNQVRFVFSIFNLFMYDRIWI